MKNKKNVRKWQGVHYRGEKQASGANKQEDERQNKWEETSPIGEWQF